MHDMAMSAMGPDPVSLGCAGRTSAAEPGAEMGATSPRPERGLAVEGTVLEVG